MSEEINNLKNYIEIERIRYSDKLILDIISPDNTNDFNIAPLVILPFVENAFKHGVSKFPGMASVEIKTTLIKNILIFNIKNTKNLRLKKKKTIQKELA